MRSQWENFLVNLGEWHGSFTQFSNQGEIIKDTPSILQLEGLNDNKTVRLTLRRFPPSPDGIIKPPVDELVREFQSLGREILFFETGAFSQGTIQLAPFTKSGAEFGFMAENRRLRLVELFDPDGNLEQLTLIREKRANTDAVERPPLTVEALLGTWNGEAITLYPDLRSPDTFSTQMQLQLDNTGKLAQSLTFADQTISSTATIDGSILHFDQGSQPVKVYLLPDGASATVPQQVQLRQAFFFEAGWLIHPNERQRLIRRYNDKGEWQSLTLVIERKNN
ncbi:DUF3598 family protein [Limnoraphis robusta]|uniref:DUF3598 family protein n=1 Tax=Limnoraphis robusta CCNP1315 TaxID=3110306 RepID=A0ABU5U0R9_9CYAN|nr:DUF3598 family protein [Limnoraphis robusta]MEA5499098.1 DUF3598 family protein [Limnoraphis robusta BA-68 BA1]MEA5520684.1 DUF3598 family protein [Limnoraphis robusta CCNP1315]MEA5545335.1 DUF3598 family protein [Limnoraphis robusta CCNP1324]